MTDRSTAVPDQVGPYRLLHPLGSGGMGTVYRAHDPRLSRDVAVKVLNLPPDEAPASVRRLLNEARAAGALRHPNILAVHDVVVDADLPYLVTDLIDGRSLRQELAAGALPLTRVLSLAVQIADGLTAAHRAGFVHRDLKPDNVMVSTDGRAIIIDFGLAKPADGPGEAGNDRTATAPHTVVGTASYMSPEQARGEPLDFRSDLFSFGAVLYEMLAGRRAFDRPSSVETLAAILTEEPRPLAELDERLPPALCAIVERCLAKGPAGRYAATADLLHDLRTLRDRGDRRPPVTAIGARRPARWRVLAGSATLIAAAAWGGATWQALHTSAPDVPIWQRITFRRGLVHAARFAPDGQTVFYSGAFDGGPMTVYRTALVSPESEAVNVPPAGLLAVSRTGELAVSLDCGFQAPSGGCTGTLARVPSLGGAPRLVAGDTLTADWGPDGQVATTRVGPTGLIVEYPPGTELTRNGAGNVRVSRRGDVAWSEGEPGRGGQLHIMVRDSRGTRALSSGWAFISGLAWNAEGSAVFASGVRPESRDDAILHIRLDGSSRVALRGTDRLRVLDAAADGRLLVSVTDTTSQVLEYAATAQPPRDLTAMGDAVLEALSDDGRLVLFTVRTRSSVWGGPLFPLYLGTTDGGPATRLGDGYGVAVSGDGQFALSRTRPEHGPSAFQLHPLGPGTSRTLPNDGLDVDGGDSQTSFIGSSRVLFAARGADGPWQTYVQGLDGTNPARVADEPGVVVSPVAPDGIRFISRRADASLWIASLPGATAVRLPFVLRGDQDIIQWSGDGQAVYLSTLEARRVTVTRVDVRSGRRELVRAFGPYSSTGFHNFGLSRKIRISRDGRLVLAGETRILGAIYVVDGVR